MQILAEIHALEVCKTKKVSNEQIRFKIKPHKKLKDIEFWGGGKFPLIVSHIVLIYTMRPKQKNKAIER